MTELLEKLIEYVETVSPLIWETFVKQIYASTISKIVTVLVFILIFLFFKKLLKMLMSQEDYDFKHEEMDFTFTVLLHVAMGFCLGIVIFYGVEALQRLYNPNYYAIKLILETIK